MSERGIEGKVFRTVVVVLLLAIVALLVMIYDGVDQAESGAPRPAATEKSNTT